MSNQANPVELAKQGSVRAIAFLINRSLQPKGVVAKPVLKDDCLHVMLEATQLPDEQALAPFVCKTITDMGIASVKMLKVYGRQAGSKSPSWKQEFNLEEQHNPSTLTSNQVLPPVTVQRKVTQMKTAAIRNDTLLECKGSDGSLMLTETELIIKRPGGIFSSYARGERHISYTDILDFQYQRAGWATPGYIYFQVSGSPKEITYIEANTNENAVIFQMYVAECFDKAKEILVQKINPQKYDNVYEGRNGTLILTEKGVIIKRDGGFFSSGTGEKTILYKNITAVQFKRADLTVGFIQLTIQGGIEAKGGVFEAVNDENTVTFGTEEKTREFEKAKSIIEQRIISASSNNLTPVNDLNQLEKLAFLRDKGIISEEEFQAKKKMILGL